MPLSDREPNFDRLRAALLRRGEPDYVPLFEVSVADVVMSGFMGRPIHDPSRLGITLTPPPLDEALSYLPDFIAFHAAAGYDYVPIKFGIGGQVMAALESRHLDGSRKVRTTHGDTSREWAAEEGGFITSWADLEAFPWPKPGTARLDLLDAAARLLPDGMRLLAVAGGMMMHARIWMGMQRFWTTLGEDPALAVALLEKLQALQIVAIDQATDCPALGAYLLDDDLAHCGGLLESPKFLRTHVFPFYKQVGDILHRKGLPFIMHTDGRINQIIPDLIACGLDALHPIEPKAMDIAAVKQQYGDRLALLGNIDVDLLARGAPDEIRTDVKARIRQVGPGGSYAIGSSNSVPD